MIFRLFKLKNKDKSDTDAKNKSVIKNNEPNDIDDEIQDKTDYIMDPLGFIKEKFSYIKEKLTENNQSKSDSDYIFDEFNSYDQKQLILGTLRRRILSAKLKVFLLACLLITSVCFDILPLILPNLFGSFLQGNGVTVYYIINLSIMAATLAISFNSIWRGIIGLISSSDPADCASSVVYIITLLHTVISIFSLETAPFNELFVPFAVLSQFLSQLNRVKIFNRLYINFAFVSKQEDKFIGRIIDYPTIKKELYRSFIGESAAVGCVKTSFVSGFFKSSLRSNPCERSSKRIIIAVLVVVLILAITLTSAQTQGAGINKITTVAACTVSLCMPIFGSCVSNSMLYNKSRSMRKMHAMMIGYDAATTLGSANSVILDAREIYNKDNVRLVGVKTFSGERIDQVLSDSAALVLEANWPLAPVFEQIIGNKYGILPKIESLTITNEHGLTGWVKGRRVIIGSAALMRSYGIVPPSKDFEDRYIKDGQSIIYLASSGELTAMFVVSYVADKKMAKKLQFLTNNGVSILVRTSDPNVTIKMMSHSFGIPANSIRLLSVEAGEEYESLRHRTSDKEDAVVACTKDNDFILNSVIACKRALLSIMLTRTVQRISSILGIALIVFLAYFGGIDQIGPLQISLYQIFWGIVIAISSRWRVI